MGEELYLSYSSAFLIGLLGSTHCLSMCGGWAALQPSVGSAATTMLFFGLGTLPSMLATGYAATWIRKLREHQRFRQIAGLLLIGFGIWTLPVTAFLHTGHG